MTYMIHACPDRMWYVDGILVPSMISQGIRKDDITVWNDSMGKGNLVSVLESFTSLKNMPGGTWHLQDDVLIARDFAEETKRLAGDKIVCGFCYSGYEDGIPEPGEVFPVRMWNSTFPCIYIPNQIAAEFPEWLKVNAVEYVEMISTGKKDDTLFREFCVHEKSNMKVINHAPHLVEHVDYIIGGSVINKWRGYIARGYFFDDDELVKEVTEKVVKLQTYGKRPRKKA